MASDSLCSIPGCGKPAIKRGWCSAHYQRWRTYGDPNYTVRTPKGVPLQWLFDHLAYDEPGCLVWPFARYSDGSGHVIYEGNHTGAARVVCTLVNGPAPTEVSEAKLSCGPRSSGCCHPKHVYWAEPVGNFADPIQGGDQTLCCVPRCNKPAARGRRGCCVAHYKRLWRHGAPLAGGTSKNAVREWLAEHADYKGTACLVWPFARNSLGYAICDATLGSGFAPNVMCRMAHGEPPSPFHEAAHCCGKGTSGCMNPNHLSWKTHAENMADTLLHGTHNRGERNGCSKLTASDVRAIRASNDNQRNLSTRFGVSQSQISAIRSRKRWAWLK
jgi:hypothetical protein